MASVYNYKYNQGCIVAMKEDRDMPVFAIVKNVYVYNTSKELFQVQELLTIYFNHQLHAYYVEQPTSPVSKLKLSQGYFIVCHHYITPYPHSASSVCVTNYLRTVSIHCTHKTFTIHVYRY